MSKESKAVKNAASRNPFRRLGGYIKESFRELKLTKFPNGKATRGMLLSALIYVAAIFLLIWGLDIFFGWVFKLILG